MSLTPPHVENVDVDGGEDSDSWGSLEEIPGAPRKRFLARVSLQDMRHELGSFSVQYIGTEALVFGLGGLRHGLAGALRRP